jgi:hypothetical protein
VVSISIWAFIKACGLFSKSDNAHSMVPAEVSVPADKITCVRILSKTKMNGPR